MPVRRPVRHALIVAREPRRRARSGHRADDGGRRRHGPARRARVHRPQRFYIAGVMAGSVKESALECGEEATASRWVRGRSIFQALEKSGAFLFLRE